MSEPMTVEQLDRSFILGQCTGLERAEIIVLKRATEAFKTGRDKEAQQLLNLADELNNKSLEIDPYVDNKK